METKRLMALRAATLVGLLAALPLASEAHDTGRGHGGRGGDMMSFGPPPVMRLVRTLNLSDVQRDQVFAVVDRYQPTLRKLMFSLGDGRQALHGILAQGGFDPTQLQTAAATQGQTAEELYLTTARMLSEVSVLLTPEQRTQLAQPREVANRTDFR